MVVSALTGCARPLVQGMANSLASNAWTGRISLTVQSEPPQSFSAAFELKGEPDQGELTLISPFGNVLGLLRWSPGRADLTAGDKKIQRFESFDAVLAEVAGTAVPSHALFSWLRGEPAQASGWSADLRRHAEGRFTAERVQPLPRAELRVVLDQ